MCVSVFRSVWWYTAEYILVSMWAFVFYNSILIRYWFLWTWNPVFVCISIFCLFVFICVCLWLNLLRKLSVFFLLMLSGLSSHLRASVCRPVCVSAYLFVRVKLYACVSVWKRNDFFFSFPSFMPRLPEGNGLFQEVGPCVFPPARSRFIYSHRLSRCGCVPKQGPKL